MSNPSLLPAEIMDSGQQPHRKAIKSRPPSVLMENSCMHRAFEKLIAASARFQVYPSHDTRYVLLGVQDAQSRPGLVVIRRTLSTQHNANRNLSLMLVLHNDV